MKKNTLLLSLILFTGLTQSCGYGYFPSQSYTPLNNNQSIADCAEVPADVALLFEGEKIDFEYEKKGMIEVRGDRYANDAELLEKIKKLAKSKCCNTIINLKKSYISRESGILFSSEPEEHYTAIAYNGIAVSRKTASNP